jgi:Xaa-Pro aminopeptidase
MADADASIRVFMEKAQDGALIAHALADAHYRLELGGSEIVTMLMVGTDPWFFAQDFKMLPRDTRFKTGDLVTAEWAGAFQGYSVQDIRTFVVGGKASAAQARVLEATKQTLEELVDRIEVGMTGDQLWNINLAAAKRAGLDPWVRAGHYMGFFFATDFFSASPTEGINSEEARLCLLPGNKGTVQEGDAITLHPGFIDKSTGVITLAGDTGIIEKGRFRLLSKSPIGYGTPSG